MPMEIMADRVKKKLAKATKNAGFPLDDLLSHVQKAFKILPSQKAQDIVLHVGNRCLDALPPGLPPPSLSTQCHGCLRWYSDEGRSVGAGVKAHLRRHTACQEKHDAQTLGKKKDTFKQVYACAAFKIVGGHSDTNRLLMSDQWRPSSPPTTTTLEPAPPPINTPLPPFLVQLGWVDHVESLGVDISVLLGYLSQPTMPRGQRKDSKAYKFENGLKLFIRVILNYLKEADRRVDLYHGRVREGITQQSRAKFSKLKDSTFPSYAATAARIFIFVLRVKYALKNRDKSKPKHPLLSLDKLLLRSDQLLMFESLYQLVIKGDMPSVLREHKLVDVAHRLLVSFLSTELDIKNLVDSVPEQMMAIEMMKTNRTTRPANFLTKECARLHRLWLSVIAHCAILGGLDKPYQPMALAPPNNNVDSRGNSEEPEGNLEGEAAGAVGEEPNICHTVEEDGDEDEDETAEFELETELLRLTQGEDLEIAKGEDNGSEESDDKSCETEESEDETELDDGSGALSQLRKIEESAPKAESNILELLKEFFHLVNPLVEGKSTIATRFKFAWKLAFPYAAMEQGMSHVSWFNNGHSFNISWKRREREIHLADLKACAQSSLDSVAKAIEDALPLNVNYNTEFNIHNIKDDISSETSFCDREDNKQVFQPLIDKIWRDLEGSGLRTKAQQKEVLKRYERITDTILLALSLTCGVPPRAWQITLLLYRAIEGWRRNIRMHRNGHVLITNPRAKQQGTIEFAACWALPHKLGAALIFYLGVIRPLEMKLLQLRCAPTHTHKLYVFTHSTKSRTGLTAKFYLYAASEINGLLIKSAFNAEIRLLRQVTIAILRQHYSHVMRAPLRVGESLGDLQSQHNHRTGILNYACDEAMHGTGVASDDLEMQME
ncbi:hypothetical protein DXG01_005192, partial [Tephrocybe rancida]